MARCVRMRRVTGCGQWVNTAGGRFSAPRGDGPLGTAASGAEGAVPAPQVAPRIAW